MTNNQFIGDDWLLAFCERLLHPSSPRQICQVVAEQMAFILRCDWTAVFYLDGDERGFALCGSTGTVPALLHDCQLMTPMELAAELGWSAATPTAQPLRPRQNGSLRLLGPPQASGAFAVLSAGNQLRGLAIAGRAPADPHSECELSQLTAIARAAAAALRHAGQVSDLRMADQTKSEFVATMSHELRNPLSAILGYTELLVQGEFGPLGNEQSEILRRAHDSASALHDLINATLDVSRFEVGDRPDQIERLDIRAILAEQVRKANDRGVARRLIAADGDGAPLLVANDPVKIGVALRQLIAAAVAMDGQSELQAAARGVAGGCAIEVSPVGVAFHSHDTPIVIDWPQHDAAAAVPFALLVARRLLEILGGTLSIWRRGESNDFTIRAWVPDLQG